MIDFGTVRPGTTLYIPFATYDSNDPSASVTLTGLATTDIEIYRDGSTTQRSSDAGLTLLDTDGIDFDGVTGIHGISINLADNSDAGFYRAGSQYTVVVASVTVDAGTINFIAATFRIGQTSAILNTTIATLSTQTSFTLTDGPAEDDALNGFWALIHDVASAVQFSRVLILDYTGSTKTVTLAAGATFTVAASDNLSVMDMAPLQPWTIGRRIELDTNGLADANVVKAGPNGAGVVWPANLTTRMVTMFDTDYASLYDSTNKAFRSTVGNWAQGGAAMVLTFERMVGVSTTSNEPAMKFTGNGTGAGVYAKGGTSGSGIYAAGGASNGYGIDATSPTTIGLHTNSVYVDANVNIVGNTIFSGYIAAAHASNDIRGVQADAVKISGSTDAADRLELSTESIVTCTASGVPTTTSIPTSACDPAGSALDQFKGRVVIFRSDTTTVALRGQATEITGSSASATPTFTVTALTTAPASGDVFVIV